MEAGAQPPPEPPINIILEPTQMAGVWANMASITQSEHEFTLDFIRLDHSSQPKRGIVVARVAFSPLLASQLSDLLMEAWQRYARTELLPGNGPEDGAEGETDERNDEPPEPEPT
jgi:hypothetical protein